MLGPTRVPPERAVLVVVVALAALAVATISALVGWPDHALTVLAAAGLALAFVAVGAGAFGYLRATSSPELSATFSFTKKPTGPSLDLASGPYRGVITVTNTSRTAALRPRVEVFTGSIALPPQDGFTCYADPAIGLNRFVWEGDIVHGEWTEEIPFSFRKLARCGSPTEVRISVAAERFPRKEFVIPVHVKRMRVKPASPSP